MELANKKLLFIGDSITEGIGTTNADNVYWKRLEICDDSVVKGYGLSGTRIARQQKPSDAAWDRYFRSRVADMDSNADAVVIFGGTNDYGHGDAALGKFTDRTDDTFYGALHNLYIDLINKYPMANIIVMTPCHRIDENNLYNDFGVRCEGNLQRYVDIIKEVAAFYSLPVLDLYNLSGMQPAIEVNRNTYMPDGVHPSDSGHERIYKLLKEFLEKLP